MALSIKNHETELLARQVAESTGESLTQAIQTSLEERLARLRQQRRSRVLTESLDEILHRVDSIPVLDTRPADEILGYDQDGLPRSW